MICCQIGIAIFKRMTLVPFFKGELTLSTFIKSHNKYYNNKFGGCETLTCQFICNISRCIGLWVFTLHPVHKDCMELQYHCSCYLVRGGRYSPVTMEIAVPNLAMNLWMLVAQYYCLSLSLSPLFLYNRVIANNI